MSDTERAERLQEELDACRELLRAAGISGFSALRDGVAAALDRKTRAEGFLVSNDSCLEMVQNAMRFAAAFDRASMSERAYMALRCELFKSCFFNVCNMAQIDGEALFTTMNETLAGVLTQLKRDIDNGNGEKPSTH